MTRRIDKPDTNADLELRKCLDALPLESFIMVSGAGSGKTTSLVKALAYIEKKYGTKMRERGQKVACITYTEIAAKEIMNDVENRDLFHVSTIHSFFWTIVKAFQSEIRKWVIQRIHKKIADLEDHNNKPKTQDKTKEKNNKKIEYNKLELLKIKKVRNFGYGTGSDFSNGVLGHSDIIDMATEFLNGKPLLGVVVEQQFPYVFIDESQDTFPKVMEAFQAIYLRRKSGFSLGFFGDPMQQIYSTGIGKIENVNNWKLIIKPENFRSSNAVRSVINAIRAKSDGLEQVNGKKGINGVEEVEGSANVFVLPIGLDRNECIAKVRIWLAEKLHDEKWVQDTKEADVKILVIEHRMAAKRLGFPDLFSAFSDNSPEGLKTSFKEGTAWQLRLFMDSILPLILAFREGRNFEVMTILRKSSPIFTKKNFAQIEFPKQEISAMKQAIEALAQMLEVESSVSIRDVLLHIEKHQILVLDQRYIKYLKQTEQVSIVEEDQEDDENIDNAMSSFFNCTAIQVWGYQKYINEESPFSTQQGIKGAEFERVVVILDDSEANHNQFSFDKLFGLVGPSKTDLDNIAAGKETVVDRTRRLFYVSCSRAIKDLAVIWFCENVQVAKTLLVDSGIFKDLHIYSLADLE